MRLPVENWDRSTLSYGVLTVVSHARRKEHMRAAKYFVAGCTIEEGCGWVNLSTGAQRHGNWKC